MGIKRGKKGSHVGIILSFVIFIAFLFFIFYILQPKLNFSTDKESFLTYLQTKVTENISANFTIANIEWSESNNPNKNCIILQDFLVWSGFATNRILVKDEAEATQEAYTVNFAGGGASIAVNRDNAGKHFFNIYNSPKFSSLADKTNNELQGMNCKPDESHTVYNEEYTIGLVKVKTEIFESEINKLIEDYDGDYPGLKTMMGIPSDTEFAFTFKKSDGTIKQPVYNAPSNANVYTDESPILYVDESANIRSGFLTIIVW